MTNKKTRNILIDPTLAFYAWIYQGSLQKATEMLAYYGLKPLERKWITRMTILNSAKKSKEYKEFLRVHGADAPVIGTTEERRIAKYHLPRLIKKNIDRLVAMGDYTLEKPNKLLAEEGLQLSR